MLARLSIHALANIYRVYISVSFISLLYGSLFFSLSHLSVWSGTILMLVFINILWLFIYKNFFAHFFATETFSLFYALSSARVSSRRSLTSLCKICAPHKNKFKFHFGLFAAISAPFLSLAAFPIITFPSDRTERRAHFSCVFFPRAPISNLRTWSCRTQAIAKYRPEWRKIHAASAQRIQARASERAKKRIAYDTENNGATILTNTCQVMS